MIVTLRTKDGQTKTATEGVDYVVINGEIHFYQSAFGGTFQLEDAHVEYEEPVVKSKVNTNEDILTRKLTIGEQNLILGGLFRFYVDEVGVIYDDDGEEFHRYYNKFVYDLTTLSGILNFTQATSYKKGANDLRYEINRLLIPTT